MVRFARYETCYIRLETRPKTKHWKSGARGGGGVLRNKQLPWCLHDRASVPLLIT
jgi:hypothetical protein